MSAVPDPGQERFTLTDAIAGLLAAASLALSGIALADRPARLAPAAILAALVAGRMSVRYQRLALAAAVAAMLAWIVGMTLAVITEHPII
jgi:hypothetical protein